MRISSDKHDKSSLRTKIHIIMIESIKNSEKYVKTFFFTGVAKKDKKKFGYLFIFPIFAISN